MTSLPDLPPKDHEEQLRHWVSGSLDGQGELAHVGGDCVPDFACCRGRGVPEEGRRAFQAASGPEREQMLCRFLEFALADEWIEAKVGICSASGDVNVKVKDHDDAFDVARWADEQDGWKGPRV